MLFPTFLCRFVDSIPEIIDCVSSSLMRWSDKRWTQKTTSEVFVFHRVPHKCKFSKCSESKWIFSFVHCQYKYVGGHQIRTIAPNGWMNAKKLYFVEKCSQFYGFHSVEPSSGHSAVYASLYLHISPSRFDQMEFDSSETYSRQQFWITSNARSIMKMRSITFVVITIVVSVSICNKYRSIVYVNLKFLFHWSSQ